jgi:hypothetical protein
VELNVPKLKGVPFETAIIERYSCRESFVKEALIEMYLAGASVRRVEDITEALWGGQSVTRHDKQPQQKGPMSISNNGVPVRFPSDIRISMYGRLCVGQGHGEIMEAVSGIAT